jgi:hypothetical protein
VDVQYPWRETISATISASVLFEQQAVIRIAMQTSEQDRFIAALEAQNQRLSQLVRLSGVGVFLLAALAVAGWNQGVPDVIRARKFEVVNDSGRVAATLSMSVHQGSILKLFGSDGFAVAELGSDNDQNGGIRIWDRFHNERFALARSSIGPNYLVIGSGNNTIGRIPRSVAIGDLGNVGMGFAVMDDKSRFRIAATVGENGSTRMDLNSTGGMNDSVWTSVKGRATLLFITKGTDGEKIQSSMTINEPAGKLVSARSGLANSTWPPPPAKTK